VFQTAIHVDTAKPNTPDTISSFGSFGASRYQLRTVRGTLSPLVLLHPIR